MRAGVVGTGFIGVVHVEALRRLGIEVAGVVGSSPERAAREAGPARAVRELRGAARRRDRRRRPHHDAEPPALRAGEGGARRRQARRLREAARADLGGDRRARRAGGARAVSCTARTSTSASTASASAARERVRAGELGRVFNVHGGYIQDWLLKDTDWNWRLDPEQGGGLRAVADIGSHWLDLVGFVTGKRIARVFGDLATVHEVRRAPTGPVETFGDGERRRRARRARDVDRGSRAHPAALRRRRRAARSSSRRSAPAARTASGSRPTAPTVRSPGTPRRTSSCGSATATGRTSCTGASPGRRATTRAGTPRASPTRSSSSTAPSTARSRRAGCPTTADFPTFADGHEGVVLGEAIAASAREGRWIDRRALMLGVTKTAPGVGNVALVERPEPVVRAGPRRARGRRRGHLRHRPPHLGRRVPVGAAGDDGARGLRRRARRGGGRVGLVCGRPRRERDVLLDVRRVRVVPRRPAEPVRAAPLDRLARGRRVRAAAARARARAAPHPALARRPRGVAGRAARVRLQLPARPAASCRRATPCSSSARGRSACSPRRSRAACGGDVHVRGTPRDEARLARARELGFETSRRRRRRSSASSTSSIECSGSAAGSRSRWSRPRAAGASSRSGSRAGRSRSRSTRSATASSR